jgi:hypothetical protein
MPWVTCSVPSATTFISTIQNAWVNTQNITTSSLYPLYVNQTNVMYPQTSSMINQQRTYYWVDDPAQEVLPREPIRMRRPEPRPERLPAEPRLPTALDRARELLLSHLTEEQRATFIENRWFVVIGGRSRMRYRIETGHLVANVRRLDDGARLCAHCDHSLPMDDHLIAQKLMLEYDEDAFLAIANRH